MHLLSPDEDRATKRMRVDSQPAQGVLHNVCRDLAFSSLAFPCVGTAVQSQQESQVDYSEQQTADLEPTKRLLLRFSTASIPHPDKVRLQAPSIS